MFLRKQCIALHYITLHLSSLHPAPRLTPSVAVAYIHSATLYAYSSPFVLIAARAFELTYYRRLADHPPQLQLYAHYPVGKPTPLATALEEGVAERLARRDSHRRVRLQALPQQLVRLHRHSGPPLPSLLY